MKQIISRRVVIISGAPGTGKTTLAEPLAEALGFALISKDHIKETLFDALGGPVDDIQFSRQIGRAAIELLWELAARCPRVVLEANFYHHLAYGRVQELVLQSQIVELYCRCSREETARRFSQRAATGARHPAHPRQSMLSKESFVGCDRPIGIGTVIEVDTGSPVNVGELANRVQTAWTDV